MIQDQKFCYLCGEKEKIKVKLKKDNYQILRCEACSFTESYPKLPQDQLLKLYGKEYFNSENSKLCGYDNYLEEKDNYLTTFKKRFQFLDQKIGLNNQKSILEVGFAYGFFLQTCEQAGFTNLTGIEVSDAGIDYAKNNLKHSKLSLNQVKDINDQKFDYIFLWDVIEHIYSPADIIEECYKMLNDGGYLIMRTPNVDSFVARILGKKWWNYKPKEHIYYFNPKTIQTLVNKFGFNSTEITRQTAGKYISKDFALDHLNRLNPWLAKLFKFMPFFNSLYLNFYDEMIIICRK